MKQIIKGDLPPLLQACEHHIAMGELDKAIAACEAQLGVNPSDINAMYGLGVILLDKKRWPLAMTVLANCVRTMQDLIDEKALEKDHPAVWSSLGLAFKQMMHDDQALDCFNLALKADPEWADAHNNLGTIFINKGDPAEGIKHCRRAIELEPKHTHAHWNLGLLLVENGQLAEGWDKMEVALKNGHRPNRQYNCATWGGSKKVDTLVVYGEQGIGDEILFASVIPELVKWVRKKLILDCHPRLMKLFAQSFARHFEGIELVCYPTRKEMQFMLPRWFIDEPSIDAKISVASLPRIFRRTSQHFPAGEYLIPDQEHLKHYQELFAKMFPGKPVVGWAWWGGKPASHCYERSVKLPEMLPLLCREDVHWVCLQHNNGVPAREELDRLGQEAGIGLYYPEKDIADFDRLTAMTAACDLIITVDQTLVHQAGALGMPCWVLTPKGCSWRYSVLEDPAKMAWWSTVRLFRQQERQEWGQVISEIGQQLTDQIEGSIAKARAAE